MYVSPFVYTGTAFIYGARIRRVYPQLLPTVLTTSFNSEIKLLPLSFQFFSCLAAVFAEEISDFHELLSF